jgi:hypothetical protein
MAEIIEFEGIEIEILPAFTNIFMKDAGNYDLEDPFLLVIAGKFLYENNQNSISNNYEIFSNLDIILVHTKYLRAYF